jgi:hypothetical protein
MPQPATHTLGTNPWTPIYLQLLADLKTPHAAGHRDDKLADTHLIDRANLFDWRTYLTPAAPSDPSPIASRHPLPTARARA